MDLAEAFLAAMDVRSPGCSTTLKQLEFEADDNWSVIEGIAAHGRPGGRVVPPTSRCTTMYHQLGVASADGRRGTTPPATTLYALFDGRPSPLDPGRTVAGLSPSRRRNPPITPATAVTSWGWP